MNPNRPAIRPELVFSEADLVSGKAVVVKDPVSERYFKLSAMAARTAALLDGTRLLNQVSNDIEEQWGEKITEHQVQELVDQMDRMGLFVGSFPATARRPERSLLAFQVRLLNPDRLLDRLHQRLGFLFSSSFVFAGVLFIAAAGVLCVYNWRVWSSELSREVGLQSVLTIYLPALLVMAVHEMAHGLTCKHFKCSVKDMGVILYYLQPCTYCDVTDSWMLGRRQRINVMLSGIFFEALIWSLAVFARQLAPEGGVISEVALGLVLSSGIKSLFNLNPLIKLDGYYVLSDLADIPNLRRRAFELPRKLIRGRRPNDLSRRQLAVLALYTPLALLYSAGILVWFGLSTYHFLEDRLGAPGRFVFLCLVILIALAGALLGRSQKATGRESSRPSRR
jgi:putative peptide zinc metalloprotease protein